MIDEFEPVDAGSARPGLAVLPMRRITRPRRWESLRAGIAATLPAWFGAHMLVFWVSWDIYRSHPLQGLYVWDTHWYWSIARYGYDPAGGLIHFFPLTSIFSAGLATVTRLPASIALFAFCWAMSLLFGALVYQLTARETEDPGAATRAAWLTQLAPGAFVLVMGYTEPLAGVLAISYFMTVRAPMAGRPRAAWAAVVLGFLSGVARPTGVLLAIPGAVEGIRAAHASGWRPSAITRAVLIAAAPAAGLASFLAYSRLRYGSWLLPFTEQVNEANRAAVMNNPLWSLQHVWSHDWRGHGHTLAVMSALLIVIFAILIVVVWRRLPISYLAWTVPSFVLAIGSQDFTSLPRYLGALFPALIGAALLARRPWQWGLMLTASCALLIWTAYFAMSGFAVA